MMAVDTYMQRGYFKQRDKEELFPVRRMPFGCTVPWQDACTKKGSDGTLPVYPKNATRVYSWRNPGFTQSRER